MILDIFQVLLPTRVVRRKVAKKRRSTNSRYKKYKEDARALAHARLAFFNSHYGFTYKKVFIKNQKTMWGSCSEHANLNFNYKIALIPPELADYVIVHELCHLKEMNHSKRFWDLMAETIPDCKARRNQLRHVRPVPYAKSEARR